MMQTTPDDLLDPMTALLYHPKWLVGGLLYKDVQKIGYQLFGDSER